MEIRLILLRHGPTAANTERRYTGRRSDPPLSEQGKRELQIRRGKGLYPPADVLYTSALRRCTDTARLLYPMLVPVLLPALDERDFGVFEGKSYEQLREDSSYRQWIDGGGTMPPPGGESEQEFAARLAGALRTIAENALRTQPRTAAVITHGGCIQHFLNRMTDDGFSHDAFARHPSPCGGGYILLLDTKTLTFRSLKAI